MQKVDPLVGSTRASDASRGSTSRGSVIELKMRARTRESERERELLSLARQRLLLLQIVYQTVWGCPFYSTRSDNSLDSLLYSSTYAVLKLILMPNCLVIRNLSTLSIYISYYKKGALVHTRVPTYLTMFPLMAWNLHDTVSPSFPLEQFGHICTYMTRFRV